MAVSKLYITCGQTLLSVIMFNYYICLYNNVCERNGKPASHPKYSEMIAAALGALKERSGSSRQAILTFNSTPCAYTHTSN